MNDQKQFKQISSIGASGLLPNLAWLDSALTPWNVRRLLPTSLELITQTSRRTFLGISSTPCKRTRTTIRRNCSVSGVSLLLARMTSGTVKPGNWSYAQSFGKTLCLTWLPTSIEWIESSVYLMVSRKMQGPGPVLTLIAPLVYNFSELSRTEKGDLRSVFDST